MNYRKTLLRLIQRVMKNNLVLFIALGITYALSYSLLVVAVFFYPSIKQTYNQYISDYKIPEATVLTKLMNKEDTDSMMSSEETDHYSLSFTVESQTRFENGKNISCRFTNIPKDSEKRYYDVRIGADAVLEEDSVLVSAYFADANNVNAGDRLTVRYNEEEHELTITNIVSIPETMGTNRNATSWYDSNDFAFIFLSNSLMNEIFDCEDFCNRIDIWFQNPKDADEVLTHIQDQLGDDVISAEKYEGSETEKQINSTWDGTKAAVTYFPIFIICVAVLFSTLFFIQIVNREDKTNGIMMAIGYDIKRMSQIFLRCALRITIISAALGLPLGFLLLRVMLKLYTKAYFFPIICITGKIYVLPILVFVIIAVSTVSSILACLSLRNVDPANIFNGNGGTADKELPRWLRRLRAGLFVKLSIISNYRNRKKIIFSVLCGIACFILTFLSFSMIFSKKYTLRYVFDERYRYDMAICFNGEDAAEEFENLDGISETEKIIEKSYQYQDGTVLVTALPDAQGMITIQSVKGEPLSIPEDGIILEEGYAREHGLKKGDVYLLEDCELLVVDIAREYHNSVQYISFATSEKLGQDEPNVLLIRKDGTRSKDEIISEASKKEGYLYYYDKESRRACGESILSAMDVPSYIIALLAFIIGAIIISTMNIVTITQNRRKYAILYLTGTSTSGFLTMALLEAIPQFIMTLIVGFAPSYFLTKQLFLMMSVPSHEFVLVNPVKIFLLSSLVVALYLIIGVCVTLINIRRINHIEVLSER